MKFYEARIDGENLPRYFDTLSEIAQYFKDWNDTPEFYEFIKPADEAISFEGIETLEELQDVLNRIANIEVTRAPQLSEVE